MAERSKPGQNKGKAKQGKYSVQPSSQHLSEPVAEYRSPVAVPAAKSKVFKESRNAALSMGKGSSLKSSPTGAVMTPFTDKPESQMTPMEKMEATRRGISKRALEQLKDKAGFDYDQLSAVLGVARATLINKKGNEKFPLALSEKIMSLADLYSFGYEVFGNQQEFNQWVFEPIRALGQQSPYSLLDSQYGREEVKNLIGRIAYGVYS